ncbi:MAG: SynChlorMet cassette protein ScmC [Candidatus Omnitrophica bacterium]|nr:SynChlorMet cassette protein ScmC [Candidatus Omnitrophota bacterium]
MNSKSYLFSAHKQASLWLDSFAYILGLNKNVHSKDNYTTIIFTHENIIDRNGNLLSKDLYSENLINSGWINYNFKASSYYFNNNTNYVIYNLKYTNYEQSILAMQDALFLLYKDAVLEGGFLLHAALVEKDGFGILLAGKGGAGKTTCCQNAKDFFNVLCDDTVLVVKVLDKYFAHPFPTWSQYLLGESKKSWDMQKAVPIKAIFFLRKAKENKVTVVDKAKTVFFTNYLAHQVIGRWNKIYKNNLEKQLFFNICEFSKNTLAFILDFNLEGQFLTKIKEVING